MEQVTIIVHGTFANPDYAAPESEESLKSDRWWRLPGKGGKEGNIADRLQQALGNVWGPGVNDRDGDLSYRNLGEWSGENTHKARKEGAKALARALDELALRRKHGPQDPLWVNFVAHSHGGNVVLESLKHLSANVKPRQLCLLGTPLSWRFADLRILYLPLLLFFLVEVGLLLFPALWPVVPSWAWLGRLAIYGLILPLPLWVAALATTIARRASVSVLGIRLGKPAYGPKPEDLEEMLGGRPVALYMCREDEADLFLHLGAAPSDTYEAMVVGRPSLRGVKGPLGAALRLAMKYLEFSYARPFAFAIGVPGSEILLENRALGFPLWQTLFTNLEMVTRVGVETYDQRQVEMTPVPASMLEKLVPGGEPADSGPAATEEEGEPELGSLGMARERRHAFGARTGHVRALRETVSETFRDLAGQLRLRHSGYYRNPTIIDDIAKRIAAV